MLTDRNRFKTLLTNNGSQAMAKPMNAPISARQEIKMHFPNMFQKKNIPEVESPVIVETPQKNWRQQTRSILKQGGSNLANDLKNNSNFNNHIVYCR